MFDGAGCVRCARPSDTRVTLGTRIGCDDLLCSPLQLLTSMSQCLSLDPLSFSVWRQLYTKHLSQSRSVPAPGGASASLMAFRSTLSYFWVPLTEPCVLFVPAVCF